jgi:hypothetical protein
MTKTKLTREEQWTRNSTMRRQRIVNEGGRVLNVVVSPEDNALLGAITEHRLKSDPKFNLTTWLSKMIAADYAQITRRSRATPKSVRAAARSTARNVLTDDRR